MDENAEGKVIKSIFENKKIPLKKEEIEYDEYFPKNFKQIEAETKEAKENNLNTAMEFNEVDIAVPKYREVKKIEETTDEIVDEKIR